ncbi:beta-lactamase [Oceanicola sp. 22II-s10i]|uniref:class D beta-lactamase n=1 Tax=Oceanicola sp. 22II-s10i TaxID=1317116 RepID=UPI000B64D67E|nr:class D beta-lactamase [Oceanicola sp. 22II-s10i]OWU85206.1 beta-lactamase [Oceanicola sp. 22II-s10i]
MSVLHRVLAAGAVWLALAGAAASGTLCTLVTEAATGRILLEEGDCRTRVTPASTFKLALAVMGFDAGILKGPDAPVLSWQPGDPDWGGAAWRRDTGPRAWLQHSVVWYSQRITRELGQAAFADYVRRFGYGNADVSGDPGKGNGLERAWLSSSLRIAPVEQAAFLRGLIMDTLPVRPEAMAKTREITERREAGEWVIHGKTGSAYPRRADGSFDRAHGWGWYVGWAGTGREALIFVRLTQAEGRTGRSQGLVTRDGLLADWPGLAARLGR